MNKKEFFKTKIPIYRKEPWTFCREVLKFDPDEWQLKVLHDVVDHTHVSVRSGQGVGKTGLEAAITLWFLTCYPFPKVIATAPTNGIITVHPHYIGDFTRA